MRGLPTGDFLRAVLENNLSEAILRADDVNLRALPHIVAYVHEHLPAVAWGSKAAVDRWLSTRHTADSEATLREVCAHFGGTGVCDPWCHRPMSTSAEYESVLCGNLRPCDRHPVAAT